MKSKVREYNKSEEMMGNNKFFGKYVGNKI